jgi:hypothetical protein
LNLMKLFGLGVARWALLSQRIFTQSYRIVIRGM